jgi:hypothetical protein
MFYSRRFSRRIRHSSLIAGLLSAPVAGAQAPPRGVVTGIVRNAVTGDPIPITAVRATSGTFSTITDDSGRFRLVLPLGPTRLDARRIGFRPTTVDITVIAEGTTRDIRLAPIAQALNRVIVTAEDEFALRLVRLAIARKQQLRGTLHDYRYHGEVRLVARRLDEKDTAKTVRGITESITEAYWEQPNKYQETIVSRRQTDNVGPERNLIGVGNILDVSKDRVSFARFELASPIADDALTHYDYHVLDTLLIGGRRTYRLAVEPRPRGEPAFVGLMDVVDSTHDVVGIDVGVNNEVRLARARDVRYVQHFAETGGGRWMPDSIDLSWKIDAGAFGIFAARHVALLSNFRFNQGNAPKGIGEYRIVVARAADKPDSALWANVRVAPLAPAESLAWKRIDSAADQPVPPLQRVVTFPLLMLFSGRDFFHYNRVDGSYVGLAHTWDQPDWAPAHELNAKLGYATGGERWQFRAGDRMWLSEDTRTFVAAQIHDETVNRPTLTSEGYDATLRALISRRDPLEYFRQRVGVLTFGSKVAKFTDADVGYIDARQSSLSSVISRPPLRLRSSELQLVRQNQPIDDGHLRAFRVNAAFDTRPRLRQPGQDRLIGVSRFTRIGLGAEWSPSSMSDFDYRRLTLRIDRRQESFGLGFTTLIATGGIATAAVPIQRSFTIDGGPMVLESRPSPFFTLGDTSFVGARAGLIAIQHDFDRLLFTRSRIPGVRDIPFTLSVRAAAFWAEYPGRSGISTAASPYTEAGFTLGNLTPFFSLFNFSARFAWQLSSYSTSRFRFGIGIGG